MRYFVISHGLRGCYMPDSSYIGAFRTRRELKSALLDEARYLTSEDTQGLSRRAIASLAADAWRRWPRGWSLDLAAPYRERGMDHWPYGLFVGHATRAEYLEAQKSEA